MAGATTDAPFGRELRIAPVMTGGTSLAVWMGGVTAELYRMLMSGRDADRATDVASTVYRGLLDLTVTTPRVDVITGTSAGGLNGAILAAAWHLNLPIDRFMAMRDIWLDIGDINALLRSPNESDPPSLLRGDDYFVPKLRDALRGWSAYRRPVTDPADGRPIDLLITVTTVTGEPRTRYDDFDQAIGERKYDHALTFVREETDDSGRDDFAGDGWIDLLAVAARTSASIPAVFEPSYLRVERPGSSGTDLSGRPNFASHASFGVGRWAVDGGVLNNLPLGAAVDRIFVQRARHDLRRVVLYVQPTPDLPPAARPDDPGSMPTLLDLVAGVAGAAWSQGVADDVDRLRAHNVRAARQRSGRLTRFRTTPSDRLLEEATAVWPQYLALRAVTSVSRMLDTAGRELTQPWRAEQLDVEAALRSPRNVAMPRTPARPGELHVTSEEGRPWGWGISSLEHAVSVALGLVNAALRLPLPPRDAPGPYVRRSLTSRDELGAHRAELYTLLSRLHAVRALDRAFWDDRVRRLPGVESQDALRQWAVDAYAEWPFVLDSSGTLVAPQPPTIAAAVRRFEHVTPGARIQVSDTGAECTAEVLWQLRLLGVEIARVVQAIAASAGWLVHQVASALGTAPTTADGTLDALAVELARHLPGAIDPAARQRPFTPGELESVNRLLVLVDQLTLLAPPGGSAQDTLLRLLAMHVLDTAYETEITTNEQVLELLQVSWDAPNSLDAGRTPQDKLSGNEAARLGAFLKRSWRANDWMWGRLDGAQRMIVLLLDPARLRQLRRTSVEVHAALAALAVTGESDPAGPLHRNWDQVSAAVAGELVFLDDDARATPKVLPAATGALTFAAQTAVAVEELPVLYEAVELTRRMGGREGDSGAFRLRYEQATRATGRLEPAHAGELLRSVRVGEERAIDEVGHDLLTRTAGQGAAVAVKVLTGERAGAPWVNRLARPLRSPTMLLYGLTRAMTTDSNFVRFLLASSLAVSGALLGVRLAEPSVLDGAVAGIAAAVFVVALGLALLRSGAYSGLPALALLAVIGLAIAGEEISAVLYGSFATAPTWKRWGFIDPWSVVLVLLLLATITAVVGFGRAASARWRVRPGRGVTAEQWETTDRAGYYALVRRAAWIVLLAPVSVLTVQWVFEQLMLGAEGTSAVKDWLVDAAGWLEARSVLLLAVALAVFGAVIGLGYDKLVRSWARTGVTWTRLQVRRLGSRGIAEPGVDAVDAGAAAPLPHPWSRLTSAQRWALAATAVVVAATSLAVMWSFDVPHGGSIELQLAGARRWLTPDSAADPTATAWAIVVDYPFLVAYGVLASLALAFFASLWNAESRHRVTNTNARWADDARAHARVVSLAAWLPLAAAAFDATENAFLLGFLGGRGAWTAEAARVLALVKLGLLALAAVVLLASAGAWVVYVIGRRRRDRSLAS